MKDSILAKYAGQAVEAHAESDDPPEGEGMDDLGAYGWLRGIRDRALMLELRKKNGNILVVSYGWIEGFEFNPSTGLTLHAGARTILIRGRNLNAETRPQVRLVNGLARHRIAWIQEADQVAIMGTAKDKTLIEEIKW